MKLGQLVVEQEAVRPALRPNGPSTVAVNDTALPSKSMKDKCVVPGLRGSCVTSPHVHDRLAMQHRARVSRQGRLARIEAAVGARLDVVGVQQVGDRHGHVVRVGDVVVTISIAELLGQHEIAQQRLIREVVALRGYLLIERHDLVHRHATRRGGRGRADAIYVEGATERRLLERAIACQILKRQRALDVAGLNGGHNVRSNLAE